MHLISNEWISISTLQSILQSKTKIGLSEDSKNKIIECRNYLDEKIKKTEAPIYGINTGFGSLYNISINSDELSQLQTNLILSHACGQGEVVEVEIAKIILFLKIQSLSYGHSGVSLDVVERLIDMYNRDIIPVLYDQGSLGASGDLAPLAHLSLPLLGLGEVFCNGFRRSSQEVWAANNWSPIQLQSKEGLALLNGTQFMLGYACFLAIKSLKIETLANQIAAMSLDGFDGRIEPFDPLIHKVRHQVGQIHTAQSISNLLQGSQIISQPKIHVQDPYSFRCIPQVHGASSDTLAHFLNIIENEINAVTDNPNIFVEEDKIISGGNFHGQPLALVLDFLAIALCEWGNISERRTYLLLSGQRGLPMYLVQKPGLNSGFMIVQYTAASIVSQNKQYATPASIDSIVSSNGQEDHVSMGANAATKCLKILKNVESILSIEALCAAQALDFRKPLKSSPQNIDLYTKIRLHTDFVSEDTLMYIKINEVKKTLFDDLQ